MELKLEDGRYVPGKYQGFENVSGGEELLQRVLMRLRVRRGSFLPMPEYGSRLHLLRSVKSSQRESAAKQFITEALSEEAGLELESLAISEMSEGELLLDMSFSYGGASLRAQTTI